MPTTPIRSFKLPLLVELTEPELLTFGNELARTIQDADAEKEEQQYLKKTMKAKLDELSARRTRLSLIVSRRQDTRMVDVHVIPTGDGLVHEIRVDTGEIIRTRPPEEGERQGSLSLSGPRARTQEAMA